MWAIHTGACVKGAVCWPSSLVVKNWNNLFNLSINGNWFHNLTPEGALQSAEIGSRLAQWFCLRRLRGSLHKTKESAVCSKHWRGQVLDYSDPDRYFLSSWRMSLRTRKLWCPELVRRSVLAIRQVHPIITKSIWTVRMWIRTSNKISYKN